MDFQSRLRMERVERTVTKICRGRRRFAGADLAASSEKNWQSGAWTNERRYHRHANANKGRLIRIFRHLLSTLYRGFKIALDCFPSIFDGLLIGVAP